ncbi:MAG: hypothetical protein JWM56_1240 [Candidatus Peribacteria bacterium]|nr:hypothetical protein [Candidatus Peribacteria bacterium]
MKSYDAPVLKKAKEILGITDAWVTYSWGFSKQTEQEDYRFLEEKLENFQTLDIKTHAYVQGTNLVFDEHKEQDYWCRDLQGRLIPYHRGRALCCPNNPAFRNYLAQKVESACQLAVDGVYVDNFHFGQFPVPLKPFVSFFGCHCSFCQKKFREKTGKKLPVAFDLRLHETQAYVLFRTQSLMQLAGELSAIAKAHGKQFGSNSFDTGLDTKLFYGTDSNQLQAIQDYVLLENYNHPAAGKNNHQLGQDIRQSPVPVFIVSYKQAIGKHTAFSQHDINLIHSESMALGYAPCYKASEFTTRGTWHNLDFFTLQPPSSVEYSTTLNTNTDISLPGAGFITYLINRFGTLFLERMYERPTYRKLFGWIIDRLTTRPAKQKHHPQPAPL